MYNHLLFLAYWFINSTVLFIARSLVPDNSIILGNWRFNSFESSIYAGFWLTFLIWVWWDFAIARKIKLDKTVITFGFFFLVNSISIWMVSRFSYMTGFGLTNYAWALAIGLTATLLQRVGWRLIVLRGLTPKNF